jgi:hypothetical protein
MAHEDKDDDVPTPATDTSHERVKSRRQVLTAAGMAAASVGLASADEPHVARDDDEHRVATAPRGATAAEFRARFEQTGTTGETFTGYGYLTRAEGTSDEDLFQGPIHSEATALFTAYATGHLVRRALDQAVHALDIEGTLTVYQREDPGASFGDPASFQVGTAVGRFALVLQDIVTVFAPQKGLPTLNGDMRQNLASRLGGPLDGKRFGRDGQRTRLFATGLGTLVDPVHLNSLLEMAGNWTVE